MAHQQGKVCLVLEDEGLIALDVQDALADAGFEVVGPFASCRAALEWLEHKTPDVALLDSALADGTSENVGLELKRRNVPFVVFSASKVDDVVNAALQSAAWLQKPIHTEAVVEAVIGALAVGVPMDGKP